MDATRPSPAGEPPPGSPGTSTTRERRLWGRRRAILPAVLAGVVLAAGGVVAYALTHRGGGLDGGIPTVALVSYYDDNIPDHWDTTGAVTGAYVRQAGLGYLLTSPGTGTVAVYGCSFGGDHFLSTDPLCEGYPQLGRYGWVYHLPPSGTNVVPLFRCWTNHHDDHFISNDPYCGGQILYSFLGYALRDSH